MPSIADAYWATPPVARTVATAVFASSIGVYTGMFSANPFYFHWRLLWAFPPGVHRFVTSFLLTGPKLEVLFDTYFVFTYLSQLEKGNSKFTRKEDLIWYLMFVGTVIIVGPTISLALCTRDSILFPSTPTPTPRVLLHTPLNLPG
jgi:Derlin-2/3